MNTATEAQPSATDWLRRALIGGAVESATVKTLAERARIGTKALRTARDRLGVLATRHGNGLTMRSVWALPVENCAERSRDATRGIRAPAASSGAMSTTVKVLNGISPAVSAPKSDATIIRLLRMVKVQPTDVNAELTIEETANAERRARMFVERGMNADGGRELAFRLVVERDRAGSKAGSCVECQCLDRLACAPGAQGHTPGPRDPAEIWMCWCARRV